MSSMPNEIVWNDNDLWSNSPCWCFPRKCLIIWYQSVGFVFSRCVNFSFNSFWGVVRPAKLSNQKKLYCEYHRYWINNHPCGHLSMDYWYCKYIPGVRNAKSLGQWNQTKHRCRSRICVFISYQSLMSKCEQYKLHMPDLSRIQQISQPQCKLNLEPGDICTCFHVGLGLDLHPT